MATKYYLSITEYYLSTPFEYSPDAHTAIILHPLRGGCPKTRKRSSDWGVNGHLLPLYLDDKPVKGGKEHKRR